MSALLLVRHAHAGSRGAWPGEDADRSLSARGWEQSRALVEVIGDWVAESGEEVVAVASSPLLRCVQTVQPLARSLGLDVVIRPALAEGSAGPTALAALDDLAAGPGAVVGCSHGDVIGDILGVLVARGAVLPAGGRVPLAKASTWVVPGGGAPGARLTYLPPPAR